MQTDLKSLLKEIHVPQSHDVEWWGLREVRETTHFRSARDAKPFKNTQSTTHGIMIEALVGGQFGYAASASLDPSDLREAARLAREQALQASKWAVHRFDLRARPEARGQHASPRVMDFGIVRPSDVMGVLIDVCGLMKSSDKIVRAQANAMITDAAFRYASTSGTELSQNFTIVVTEYSATAQDGQVVQRRSDGDTLQAGAELFMGPKLAEMRARARRVGEQAHELLSAEECPTETTSLILMPDQMVLQIHESIGHPLELDRILGDERNYAGWSFVRPKDFGTLVYGSPLMNVTFDPTVEGEMASYAYDDGGARAERRHLIKNGILVAGLGGVESQLRSKLPGVSNFRACSWNRPPVDRMANINLEPGDSTLEEMIASVESGVLMETNRSWSIDDYRNKFQFGCEYAKKIEKGRLTKTLRNPNYRGVTNPFWRGLRKVGNADTMLVSGSPYCGKAEPNQMIRVGHRTPACLFENVEIFGGAS